VNDASSDDSAQLLQDWSRRHPQLRVITLRKDELRTLPGKKYALDKGIAAAKFDTLLLTDADCQPASDQWLRLFAQKKTVSGKAIILGYGAYFARSGFLNRFIRWETVHTATQYLGLARSGNPYMGVGRNLMYEKQLYDEAKKDNAFWKVYRQTPSGDDDLLIGKFATTTNVNWCISEQTLTRSLPQTNWRDWMRQKTRHLSTGKFYGKKTRLLLAAYAFSQGSFWLLWLLFLTLAAARINQPPEDDAVVLCAAITGCIRLITGWILNAKWCRLLGEQKLISFFPFGDFCWAVYNLIFAPYIFWKNKQEWK
jgi:hypothetical protein